MMGKGEEHRVGIYVCSPNYSINPNSFLIMNCFFGQTSRVNVLLMGSVKETQVCDVSV